MECPYSSENRWAEEADGTWRCGPMTMRESGDCPEGEERYEPGDGWTYCYDPEHPQADGPPPGGSGEEGWSDEGEGSPEGERSPGADPSAGSDWSDGSSEPNCPEGTRTSWRSEGSYQCIPTDQQCEFGEPYTHSSGSFVCPPPPKGSGYCGPGQDVEVDESGGWGCPRYNTSPPEPTCPEGTTATRTSETSWRCDPAGQEGVPECPSGWQQTSDGRSVCHHSTAPGGGAPVAPTTPRPDCGGRTAFVGPDSEWYCEGTGRPAGPKGEFPTCSTGSIFQWADGTFYCSKRPFSTTDPSTGAPPPGVCPGGRDAVRAGEGWTCPEGAPSAAANNSSVTQEEKNSVPMPGLLFGVVAVLGALLLAGRREG